MVRPIFIPRISHPRRFRESTLMDTEQRILNAAIIDPADVCAMSRKVGCRGGGDVWGLGALTVLDKVSDPSSFMVAHADPAQIYRPSARFCASSLFGNRAPFGAHGQ